jgi:hypothetical protein
LKSSRITVSHKHLNMNDSCVCQLKFFLTLKK